MRGGQDDVEGIIDPLNKTKIDDQQKPDLTNISKVRKAGRESVENIVKNIEAQSTDKPPRQDRARTVGAIQAKLDSEKAAREKLSNKTTAQKPRKDKENPLKTDQPSTRRREAEKKRMENQKKPKKGQTELPPRKIAIEIVEVSDDDDACTNQSTHVPHAKKPRNPRIYKAEQNALPKVPQTPRGTQENLRQRPLD